MSSSPPKRRMLTSTAGDWNGATQSEWPTKVGKFLVQVLAPSFVLPDLLPHGLCNDSFATASSSCLLPTGKALSPNHTTAPTLRGRYRVARPWVGRRAWRPQYVHRHAGLRVMFIGFGPEVAGLCSRTRCRARDSTRNHNRERAANLGRREDLLKKGKWLALRPTQNLAHVDTAAVMVGPIKTGNNVPVVACMTALADKFPL